MKKLIILIIFMLIIFVPLKISTSIKENIKENTKEPIRIEQYHTVKVAMYQTTGAQTDSTPLVTASGFKLDSINPARHKIIAVSYDLKKLMKWGTKVRVEGIGKYDGIYVVRDLMNQRWIHKIDILINSGDKAISFAKARLYVL